MTAQGLDALFTSAPLTIQTNPDRLGLPVLGSLLSGVGVSPWRLMYVTAAVAAAVVACSAWGLARAVTEPRWAGPIYAVAVVSSIPFALTSRAYLDNALAEGMIIAVAATALLSAARRGATLAGVVLLGGTLVMHWPTGTLLVAVLTLFTVGLIPSAWADRRAGKPLTSTSAARVGTIAVGGLGVGGIPLLLAPGANTPTQGPGTLFRLNVERLLPAYRLHLTLPLAGGRRGGARDPASDRSAASGADAVSRVWLLPLGVAALAYGQDRPIPLMRFFGTALAAAGARRGGARRVDRARVAHHARDGGERGRGGRGDRPRGGGALGSDDVRGGQRRQHDTVRDLGGARADPRGERVRRRDRRTRGGLRRGRADPIVPADPDARPRQRSPTASTCSPGRRRSCSGAPPSRTPPPPRRSPTRASADARR